MQSDKIYRVWLWGEDRGEFDTLEAAKERVKELAAAGYGIERYEIMEVTREWSFRYGKFYQDFGGGE